MSSSRDDFSIAFRSALLQRGGAQKFSVLSLIFLALIIFFLDVYGVKFTKPVRGFINDVVYRVTFLASTPTRFFPQVSKDLSNYFNVIEENERLKAEIEKFKSLELNVEFLQDENNGNVNVVVKTRNFPGGTYLQSSPQNVVRSAAATTTVVEQFTDEVNVRLRGRSFALRISSDTTEVAWRLGTPRLQIRTDGRR